MKDYTVLDGQITCLRNKLYDEAYQRGYADGREYEQMLRIPKHDANRIEQIKDLIRECDKIDAYTLSFPAWKLINKLKKIVGFELEDYEEPQKQEIPKYCEDCIFSDGTLEERKIHCYRCYYKSEWKDLQTEEIKVGDEVHDKYNPYPRVVTSINKQDMADLIDARGNAHSDSVFCLKKTGRHFPQIAEVLEQMRKESE